MAISGMFWIFRQGFTLTSKMLTFLEVSNMGVLLFCGLLWPISVFQIPLTSARLLNERETTIAVERVRANRTGIKNPASKPAQALEALNDPQV